MGVWQITLVIDGDDEVYTLLLPGEMKMKDAKILARDELHCSENTARKYVHVSAVELLP